MHAENPPPQMHHPHAKNQGAPLFFYAMLPDFSSEFYYYFSDAEAALSGASHPSTFSGFRRSDVTS
jgi:hypothetical protein